MKKVIVGIGVPGSGKSTVLKEFASRYSYSYICPDDIRVELTGDAADQSKNKEVWAEAYERTRKELTSGHTVVFDATFTHPELRKSFLTFVKDQGAEKIEGIFVNTPFELARERNLTRERKVPDHALERMNEGLKSFPPDLSDGFDALFTLNEHQQLQKAELAAEVNRRERKFDTLH